MVTAYRYCCYWELLAWLLLTVYMVTAYRYCCYWELLPWLLHTFGSFGGQIKANIERNFKCFDETIDSI